MAIKYSKAPISEVVLGITFDYPLFKVGNILFDIINLLKNDYSEINSYPPLADEELKGYRLVRGLDANISGPTLYRLRNKNFMVQLQLNKIYINWIRGDNEIVGNYPGFNHLLGEFNSIYQKCAEFVIALDKSIDVLSHVKYFELLYQDRFIWQEYINDLGDIDKIINMKNPSFGMDLISNNIFSNYTVPIDEISGYSKIAINTNTSNLQKQLLLIENNILGNDGSKDFNSWFKKSHALQINFFNAIFSKDLLDKWK